MKDTFRGTEASHKLLHNVSHIGCEYCDQEVKERPYAIYPATGPTQIACGIKNGIWGAWYIHHGKPAKFMHQSSRTDALQLFDDLTDVFRLLEDDLL